MFHLLEHSGFAVKYIYLTYILFFVLVAWNIVTSTFVESAFRLAQPDLDKLIQDQQRDNHNAGLELKALFQKADRYNSNRISWDEFKKIMSQDEFRQCLEVRGVNINDMDVFFKILVSAHDDAKDEV